ncbi:MAG: lysylphosphatidylglycerol synthase domain-containing protein [Chloroflexota bacterium]
MKLTNRQRVMYALQYVFLLIALLFIGFLLFDQWTQLRAEKWRYHSGWFSLSVAFLLASWWLEIEIWRRLLIHIGDSVKLSSLAAIRIWFLSAVVRYIPGNIWQPLSMTVRCQQRGIRPEATLASIMLFQIVILLGVIPIAGLYFWIVGYRTLLPADITWINQSIVWLLWLGTILAIATFVLFMLRPQWFFALGNWGLQKLNRPPLDVTLSSATLAWFVLLAVVNWVLWGASFAALTFAIGDLSTTQMWAALGHLMAAFPIAYAIGFISFLTPSGLGVREGAFYVLLTPVVGGAIATVAALATRIVSTLGELIIAGICLWFQGNLQKTRN